MKFRKMAALGLAMAMTASVVPAYAEEAETETEIETEAEDEAFDLEAFTEEFVLECADVIAACENDPAITLVMAEVNPLDTIVGQTDSAFKLMVEALSNGTITIDLQASGVLGSENDVLDSMLGGLGMIDISRISAFALNSYGAEKSTLLSIPYTFTSRAHYWNFVMSDLAQEFLDESLEKGLGVKGLFYGEEGFRHFFTTEPVNEMADLAGMKLRVSNDPVMTGMVESLGASATVVAFGELYSALQTGVVDGAEQPIANYKSNAFPEVAANLILDGHTLGAIEVIIAEDSWNNLTENQQAAVECASAFAEFVNMYISQEAEDEVLAELIEEGVNVVAVEDKTPWQEACAELIASCIEGQEDLYQQILDFAEVEE